MLSKRHLPPLIIRILSGCIPPGPALLGDPLLAPGGPACTGPAADEGGPKLPPGGKGGTLPGGPGGPLGGKGGTPVRGSISNSEIEGSKTCHRGRSLGEAWSLEETEVDRQEVDPWLLVAA